MSFETGAGLLLMVAVLSARIGTALAMFPMFSANTLPISVRGTITVGLSLCLLPVVGLSHLQQLAHLDAASLVLLLAKEVGLGFVIGLVGSAGFWAVQAAGSIIENQAGLSMATTVDPLAGQEDSMIGGFLMQVVSVIFLASGGLLSLLGAMYESFRVWPVSHLGPSIDPSIWLNVGLNVIRVISDLALRVAAPFVLLMLMVEVGLGMLGRYAPNFSVFFLALPFKAMVLLTLLMVYVVVMADGSAVPDVAGAIRRLFPAAAP